MGRGVNMETIEILACKACLGDFTKPDIDSGGYCFGCAYERDARLDNLTGGNDE